MSRALALAALASAAAWQGVASGGTPVRLALPWQHQAQFAGCYAAVAQGLYARQGLDVTLVRGGPDRDPVGSLRRGEADAAVLLLTAALGARQEGVDVVNCAQVVNRSNLMIVAWRDRGVRHAGDLDGRRLGMWEGPLAAPFLDFLAARGVRPVLVPQYSSVELFLRRGLDACAAMEYNEYHRILQSGVDAEQLTVVRLRDAGAGIPEDGVYVTATFIRAHPGAAERLAACTLAGWRWVAQHRQEALELTMSYLRRDHVSGSRAQMRWMLDTLLPAIFPGPHDRWAFGVLDRGAYERAATLLVERGLLRAAPPYDAFRAAGGAGAP
ncbi:MAG TPA: ABC transporter substrate-binding protein [Thermoanaerobaculaceae bacterium]|nr:ABC transporter substrate-binding protein [Thermoanaerobaculaceae bacterium]